MGFAAPAFGDAMSMRASLLASLLSVTACGGAVPAKRPPSPPAARPAATPAEAETPPAAPPAEATEPEVAAAPASAWAGAAGAPTPVRLDARDRRAIVRELCESKPVVRGRCACPSYAELEGVGLQVGEIITGHFSGPGRDEALVATSGCETGAGSSMTDGSRALVRRTAAGWERVFAESGAVGDCKTIVSRRGRTRLVCEVVGGRFGQTYFHFDVVAFDELDGEVREQRTPIVSFSTQAPTPGFDAPSPLFELDVTRFAVRAKSAYEAGDDRALGLDLGIQSRVSCARAADCAGVDTTTKSLSLTYSFDGESFSLAPSSRADLAVLEARSPR